MERRERRTPPRMVVLAEGLDAWQATTLAFRERRMSNNTRTVLTAWDKETDTWKVCASIERKT